MEVGSKTISGPLQELAFEPDKSTLSSRFSELGSSIAKAILRWPIGIWGAIDIAFCVGGFILAHLLSPQFDFHNDQTYNIGFVAIFFATAMLFWNYALGLYDRHQLASVSFIIRNSMVSSVLGLGLTTIVVAWLGFAKIGRFVLFDAFLLAVSAMVICRLLARLVALRSKIQILFVGNRAKFRMMERELRRTFRGFYHRPMYIEGLEGASVDRVQALKRAVHLYGPDEIVVEDNNSIILDLLKESSDILQSGCEIRSHAAYYESLLGQIPVDTIDCRGLLGGGVAIARQGRSFIKRLLDLGLASFGLIVGGPVILLVAAMVKMTSPGPVIYTQVRVGRYGKPFNILKFRSMRTDAEKNGAVWAKSGDSRVTPIGKLLRKSRLDELPQLWNILRGDMSFVGPRPERPEFVKQLRDQIPHYDLRHLVPPGLTGWAQVRYRYGASVEDARRKLAFDLYYFRHYGPLFDLAICLRTLVAMAKGAR